MDVEHIGGTYYAGQTATQEAFEELCAMVENINVSGSKQNCIDILLPYFDFILYFDKAEREEARERGQIRCQMLRARLARQKEKLHCLREKYTILLDM